jgi:hypothetical protein
MPAEDMTINAQWTVNQYTITFVDTDNSIIGKVTANYGADVTAPTKVKEGYTFASWDKEVPAKMPAENMTITAQWTVNSHTVTYKSEGETLSSKTVSY